MDNIRIQPQSGGFDDEQGPVLDKDEIYDAQITGFGSFTGQFGPGIVWRFLVFTEDPETGDPTQVEAAGFTSESQSYNPDDASKTAKLVRWTIAAVGVDAALEGLDLVELEGKPVRVEVDNYEKNGIVKNKVTNVRPPRKSGKARTVAEVA